MSYELIAILSVMIVAIAGFVVIFFTMVREFREMRRISRAIAGLVVQESDRIRDLLRA